MTEEKLAPQQQKPRKWRVIGLVVAALCLLAAGIWLFRQPIAGLVLQSVCAGQKLACSFDVNRADAGGLTLSDVDIRNPRSANPALSARRIAIDLNWDGLFSPHAASIGGEEVAVRLDLTGERPLLGDLDEAVKSFTRGGGEPGPMPRLDFKSVRVLADTSLGPVEAHGRVLATGPDSFDLELTAPAAKLGFHNAELLLDGAEFRASVDGDEIDARAKLDLAKFETEHSSILDVAIDVSVSQSAGLLTGEGTARLGRVDAPEAKLADVSAQATVTSAAVDPAAFALEAWLRSVSRLDVSAFAGGGGISGVEWKDAELTAQLSAAEGGGATGEAAFAAGDVKLAQGAVGRLEIGGSVSAPAEGQVRAQGVARALDARLGAEARTELANAASAPLDATLPAFAAAAHQAIDRAGQRFDVSAPWSAAAVEGGFDVAVLTGASLRAHSGLMLSLSAQEEQEVAAFSTVEGGRWTAAGSLAMSGGGGPAMTVSLARATGAGRTMSMAGAAAMKAWRVGNDVLTAEATGLEFDTTETGGSAAGQFAVRLDGVLAGGVWTAARGTGAIKSAWTPTSFYADAPRGLLVQWAEGKYGETVIGEGALHFTPRGRLAEQNGEAIVGQGVLAPVTVPVSGGGYSAQATIGATAVNWRAEGGLLAAFDAAPSTASFTLGERVSPIRVEDVSGTLDLRRGWRVKGAFRDADVKADEATLADIRGRFDLGGEHGSLDGTLREVSLRVFDPLPEAQRRFEEATFEGAANLRDSIAEFSGLFTLAGSGVQIANVSGRHDLGSGEGSLAFAPMPLIFRPRSFQPYELSPLLRGPANVTGRVDISGVASWSADGIDAGATLDLRNLGFALAAAGVFEGVSGHVEVADLLRMTSAPGQTITIGKVTLGMPLDNGTIRFQLIGYDAIRIESAQWPFAGGFIRVKPADFSFAARQNEIVAEAVNWDLNRIIELFKVPDIKLEGVVNGDIPLIFSTGSAEIEEAQLVATDRGGVIKYTGSTGDAAAQADSSAKMLFDALKDFRYEVLKVGLDGNLAGRIVLSVNLLGRNPNVLDGAPFQLNISVDSALMNLLNMTSLEDKIKAQITPAPPP